MICIASADPRSPEATGLMTELSAELSRRYPEKARQSHTILDVSDFIIPGSVLVVARVEDRIAGCGAFRPIEPETAEIKRMYVAADACRQGIGKAILAGLERLEAQFGYRRLRLETGIRQPEAIALYTNFGFVRIPCFGKYATDPLSVCFEKENRAGQKAISPRATLRWREGKLGVGSSPLSLSHADIRRTLSGLPASRRHSPRQAESSAS